MLAVAPGARERRDGDETSVPQESRQTQESRCPICVVRMAVLVTGRNGGSASEASGI